MSNCKSVFKKNDKGIALISILIAISFVSIIGSALLYITYKNYQMKVLNLNSKENYYETDGRLVEVTAALRNAAITPDAVAGENKILKVTSVQDPFDPMKTTNAYSLDVAELVLATYGKKVGTQYQYAIEDGQPLHDAKVTSLKVNGDTITFGVEDDSVVTKASNTGDMDVYTISGFYVLQKKKDISNKSGDYTNKVKTDITFKLRPKTSSKNEKGIGDFSMIADNSISIDTENNFSFVSLYGDNYFSKYYYGTDDDNPSFGDFTEVKTDDSGTTITTDYKVTMPGKYDPTLNRNDYADYNAALYLMGEAKLNILGDYCVVYGDLVLTDQSCMVIQKGNLTVYGDIYLEDESLLICNGQIYQPKSVLPGRDKQCSIYPKGDDIQKHLYLKDGVIKYTEVPGEGKTVATNFISDENYILFCKTLGLADEERDNDGVVEQIVRKVKADNGKEIDIFSDLYQANTNKTVPSVYYGQDCGVKFNPTDTINDECNNKIVFITYPNKNVKSWWPLELGGSKSFSQQKVKIVKSNYSSTFISRNPVTVAVQHGVYITNMGNDVYNYLTIEDEDDPYYDSSIHKFDVSTGGQGDFKNVSAGSFLQDRNTVNNTIQNMLNYSCNQEGAQISYINSLSFSNYVKDAD